jgi:hypothetical protein|tara:strand:+ start:51 stop:263 length:213 start_codon:yes stop_codon:yes gene_type:complete
MKTLKIIGNSLGIVMASTFILGSVYTLLGLILNFWNESTLNASVAFIAALLIGTLSLIVLDLLIKVSKKL